MNTNIRPCPSSAPETTLALRIMRWYGAAPVSKMPLIDFSFAQVKNLNDMSSIY